MALRDNILSKLEDADGFVSGEELAGMLGVSRAAVWKSVKQLKDAGCKIESVSNRGYRLISPADTVTEESISRLLEGSAKRLKVIVLDTVDSTNNEAKRMLSSGFSDNALIIANEQTAGRGRMGRSFYSPKNTGVYMSFLLASSLSLSDAVSITTAAAVAVVRAIENVTGIVPQIKWVNDVYCGGKKVCGILTEAVGDFETSTARSVIIGIGINITTEDYPEEIADRASSLKAKSPVRNEIIAAVSRELLDIWQRLPDRSGYIECYKQHSMIIGKDIDFYINNVKHSASAVDITDEGGLVVRLPDGSRTVLTSGEVTVRLSDNA